MSSVRLNSLDAAWVFTEARATPNHVGGLLQFRLPEGAPRDFLRKLMTEFRGHREFKAPWNRRLKYAFNKNPIPVWIEDDDIDLEYHVRHSALPWPGGERELGELVGRLQSTPLDLSRPPWECTIIEGLDGNRYALFIKMHHSLIDGVSGMKLLQRAMSPDRERSLGMPPFWAAGSEGAAQSERAAPLPTFADAAAAVVKALSGQVQTVPQLIAAFGTIIKRIGDPGDGMVVPFVDSPRSVLNGRIREKRRFATQQFSLERMRRVAKAADATLNDVVLAICAGALRRFLHERNSLPQKSLTAGIPVSVRPKDDEGTLRHHLHRRRAGHRHRRSGGAPCGDQDQRPARQSAPAEPADAGDGTVHDAADGHVVDHDADGHRRAHAPDVQRHDLQRAGTGQAVVLPRGGTGGHVPGVHRPARAGAQHHLPELRRQDELRLHRLSFVGAAPAAAGRVFGRCVAGARSRDPAPAEGREDGVAFHARRARCPVSRRKADENRADEDQGNEDRGSEARGNRRRENRTPAQAQGLVTGRHALSRLVRG